MHNEKWLMQGLRSGLMHRRKRIMSGADLIGLDFAVSPKASFTAVAIWQNGRLVKLYTPGNSLIQQKKLPQLKQSLCRFADELIQEVLNAKRITR